MINTIMINNDLFELIYSYPVMNQNKYINILTP